MGAILFNVTTAALMVMMVNCGLGVVGRDTLRSRPLPWAAIALTATVDGLWLELCLDPATFGPDEAARIIARALEAWLPKEA